MTKQHPEGETPAEAIERIAPQPARATFGLTASGDKVVGEAVVAVFKEFIRQLRATGLAPAGTLHLVVPAWRTADGTLVAETIVNLNAVDVEADEA